MHAGGAILKKPYSLEEEVVLHLKSRKYKFLAVLITDLFK